MTSVQIKTLNILLSCISETAYTAPFNVSSHLLGGGVKCSDVNKDSTLEAKVKDTQPSWPRPRS